MNKLTLYSFLLIGFCSCFLPASTVGQSNLLFTIPAIIAASNRDLLREIEEGRFREDLYYRLNVVTIEQPPLRDRPEDIPALVTHFLKVYSGRTTARKCRAWNGRP